ncbi:MAG: rhomboid family intramembrane serine protease, partial [Candidatus Nanoarchaeia archaeon]
MARMRFYALWIALICIILFILQNSIEGFTELLLLNQARWFEIWRFITSIFIHASVGHLLYNMFALVLFGLILEKVVSSKKFLLVFFITGIFANIIAINFYPRSLGASGAIYGLIGLLAIIKPKMG